MNISNHLHKTVIQNNIHKIFSFSDSISKRLKIFSDPIPVSNNIYMNVKN